MKRTALLAPIVLIAVTSACTAANGTQDEKKPQVIAIATNVELADDGTVTWVTGKIDSSGPAEPNVVPADDRSHSAKFAKEVELLTPQGCKQPYGDLKVDNDGLGQTRCTLDAYRQVDHYAPKIWLDADGRITKIADRYHP